MVLLYTHLIVLAESIVVDLCCIYLPYLVLCVFLCIAQQFFFSRTSQDFVLPDLYTFLLMLVLGVLAFLAEVPSWTSWWSNYINKAWYLFVLLTMFLRYRLLNSCAQLQVFLARGLQLEKTSKVANVQYMAVPFLPLIPSPPLPTFLGQYIQ